MDFVNIFNVFSPNRSPGTENKMLDKFAARMEYKGFITDIFEDANIVEVRAFAEGTCKDPTYVDCIDVYIDPKATAEDMMRVESKVLTFFGK